MKLGSLFSGCGMGDFGFLAAGMDIRWQCEIDEGCQKRLKLRYPESDKYYDIEDIKTEETEKVDIIAGGFPCQPFSFAGRRKGKEDKRYLWEQMLRVIQGIKPRWIVGENVYGLLNMGLKEICSSLEEQDYEIQPIVFPSSALGTWHKRERIWILGHTKYDGFYESQVHSSSLERGNYNETGEKKTLKLKRSISTYETLVRNAERSISKENPFKEFWLREPKVVRMVHGCSDRVDRIRMLANGQVPACTYVIGKMIMEIEKGVSHGNH